jgi:hypothetical protein
MSNLVYQNYNNRCQGWSYPSLLVGPQINSLSGYQSPAGSNTLVSINGINFFSFSGVKFGTFTPTTYFINSNLLQFYVPNTLTYGNYPVQVFNGSIGSNIVSYNIDDVPGYWMIDSSGSSTVPCSSLTNSASTGSGVVYISSLSRGAPYTINNTSGTYDIDIINNPSGILFPIPNNLTWIICNGQSQDTTVYNTYLQLNSGCQYIGCEITVKTIGGAVYSSSSNILPINSSSNTNLIVSNTTGKWATLVFDGSYWIIMQSN